MAEGCDFADGVMIRRLYEKGNWKRLAQFQAAIENATGTKVSEPTIKRALKGDPMTADILGKIAKAFEVPPWVVTIPRDSKNASYAFEDIMAGARQVARKLRLKPPPADAVLTFPGASSIFAGLVLRTLPLTKFLRIPVYTAIFKKLDDSGPFRRFREVTTTRFKILVPEALFKSRHKRVVVIDDVILSGVTMEELRKTLERPFGKGNVIFACCICGQFVTYRTRPKIIGLSQRGLVRGSDFALPWGKPYANEDAFPETSESCPSTRRKAVAAAREIQR